ncbi:hypothetical protein [Tuwongella immobilis]|uniref:Peptidase C14 caspase catalytic subunit p20 n=1 Tax=Tuwongella immobilis TaxID=692036 RepID=A0A6C2YM32_9BACT|nr:hypothetical protein [Tuwongella immobilis]VIP02371.1 Peptidase C14 caspase catalytic subunit p20 OS=Pirellula staleyi (strain ATCC 27377 / DSM 6068 / ICPB 4128) GN=Psta_2800 PE=4 SV=1 [Tuwongella immobilis]VTS01199.1 Peptidase C14 caspase catalytic subunit p20 OS=Pirellula staleyi (strain ATCC 27377 / DSM 6068 / ICPB 4128) GN=Psta_2800 PE=4 SV=1 [Tuwongella immobilis]
MARTLALLIAVDKSLDTSWNPPPFARAEIQALSQVLIQQGIPLSQQCVLTGELTTRAILDGRTRQWAATLQPDDTALIAVVAPLFQQTGQNRLIGFDTLPDLLDATSFPLDEIWHRFRERCRTILLLDPSATGGLPPFAESELEEFAESGNAGLILTACSEGEPSRFIDTTKQRAWLSLVREALAGRAPSAASPKGAITGESLLRYLNRELPRLLRKHFDDFDDQHPMAFGDRSIGVGTVPKPSETNGPLIDADQIQRIRFRAESTGRVKALSGFLKTHRVPDTVNAAAEQFIGRIARTDVQADLDDVYQTLRDQFSFARKDLESRAENDGTGYIRTPRFDYFVSVGIDPDDPTLVRWRREIGRMTNLEVMRGPDFQSVFGNLFDQLIFDFAQPLDLIAIVDRIEEAKPKGVKVRLAGDARSCTITITGFSGLIHLEANELRIEGRSTNGPASLLEQFLDFQRRFSGMMSPRALPPG